MIEFMSKLINDSESIRQRESGNKYNEDSYKRERPYSHSAKATNLKRYFAKLQTDLKENFEPFKDIDFSLSIDKDYCDWEGWQLDVNVLSYDLADKFRISVQYEADPEQELDESDIDDIHEDMAKESERLANNGIDEV